MSIAVLFAIATLGGSHPVSPPPPATDERMSKCGISTNGILFNFKKGRKETLTYTTTWMNAENLDVE